MNCFRKKLHLRCLNFVYTFREVSFTVKKLGRFRHELLQMLGETLSKKLLLLPKNLNSCLPVFLKLRSKLLLNKGPSNFFKKLNWKFGINLREIVTKSICEFPYMPLPKIPEICEAALLHKKFFLNVNSKGIYFIWVRLKGGKA